MTARYRLRIDAYLVCGVVYRMPATWTASGSSSEALALLMT